MADFNNGHIKKYKHVGGWLLLFCFGLTIGGPLRTSYNLITSYNEASQYFIQFPGIRNLVYIDVFVNIGLMILSIRAGIALWSIKAGAVKIAKKYLLSFLAYSIIAIFLPFTAGLPAAANAAMIAGIAMGAIQSLFYFGIWYWYLNVSKRVAATYIIISNPETSENLFHESEKPENNNYTEAI